MKAPAYKSWYKKLEADKKFPSHITSSGGPGAGPLSMSNLEAILLRKAPIQLRDSNRFPEPKVEQPISQMSNGTSDF